jgi:hypothetical protein
MSKDNIITFIKHFFKTLIPPLAVLSLLFPWETNIAFSQTPPGAPQFIAVYGCYNSVPPSLPNLSNGCIQVDSQGRLAVNVQAGGAGGGLVQNQVRNASNVWTDVGFASGDQSVPVNVTSGSVSFTGAIPTGSNSIGTVGLNAGANVIGGVTQSGTWNVGLSTGANTVGNVGLVAGSAIVGSIKLVDTAGTNQLGINASNQALVLASQSGTWTVQPGNTANTTPWLTSDSSDTAVTPGTAPSKASLSAGQFNTSLPTLTNGQTAAVQVDSSGRQLIGTLASGTNAIGTVGITPSSSLVCNSVAAINQTTSSTVITGVSAKKIYFCGLMLVSGTAQSVSLIEGTGTVCATGISQLMGGSSASIQVTSNGGFAFGSGQPFLVTQVAADNVCVLQSGAGNISGFISYIQQ